MHARTALKKWLRDLPEPRLTELLEERRLPEAAGHVRLTSFDALAGHLLTDASVARGLDHLTAGELQLLAALTELALERHGPLPPPPFSAYAGGAPPAPEVEPYDRLLPETEVLDYLAQAEGVTRERLTEVTERLRARALLLPAPAGRLALPAALHAQAADLAAYGRPVDTLLTRSFNAPEIKQIATVLGAEEPRTRDAAQQHICRMLGDPYLVRDLLTAAPPAAHDLLERLAPGPPWMLTHCFERLGGGLYGGPYGASKPKFGFRDGGSGDEGTDWLAAHGMVVPVDEDLVELPYEVGRALRDGWTPVLRLDPEPLTRTVPLPREWDGQGAVAAGAAAWRAELVLRELAARPVTVRKAGGVAVRDTRRLAKAAGADEAHARLWLDLAAHAGLAAPQEAEADEPARDRGRGGARGGSRRPPARVLPTERYDAWSAAGPAAKLLPLISAWAVLPETLSHWPDDGDTPVALVAPDDPLAVPLRHGVLRALATLPDGHGLRQDRAACEELLACAAWFEPVLHTLVEDAEGEDAEGADAESGDAESGDAEGGDAEGGDDGSGADGLPPFGAALHRRLDATLAEAGLLGLVAHGALTDAGRAVTRLLDAGAARHYPAVPGAYADPSVAGVPGTEGLGTDLASHPRLAEALAGVRAALHRMLPAPATTARFQADSTATVTGTPAPGLSELLSAVGDIESEGHAVVWRITPASLRRAYDAGWDADEVHARLREVAEGGELPQPLAYTLKDTARSHGRLRVVRSPCCVRSDDTSLLEEVVRARGLARLRLRRIAPTVLISTAGEQETLAALRAAGYAPALEAETGTTVLERVPAQRARSLTPALDAAHRADGPFVPGGPATAHDLARALTGGG
ncbi:helicase-associated domain-containing protein [Streptomyces sp. JJ36]|uniref:helicase-associated domain-containing protein n=1 Tax=Streptomyces sp. JJ36 TaxID=2736645 RepID=UPI001F32D026|nr:helicase-associated domain-containing protein [Streptomyces sp. JJ36]MCF6524226.1 helicase-associated domain-containing protein [Streptomyces sp. JJ36]